MTAFIDFIQDSKLIRKKFLSMHFHAQAGHIGTGLSSIEILTVLYKSWLQENDRFILSKGHGASALYATLHHYGRLNDADLETYYKDHTLFPAHPAANAHPQILAATGSLGHGLPIAVGYAYAQQKLMRSHSRMVCLMSDGECNEGTTWEAALFAAHHELSQLTVIIDANGLQGFGKTQEVLRTEPFREKWQAFGFDALEIQGHDFQEILQALDTPRQKKPLCIIARTVKGKGVSFMEDKMEWHYLPMTANEFELSKSELEKS